MNALVEQLDTWLSRNGQTLGLAESCTGGLIAATLTERAGVSRFFKGGIVSYAGSVKNGVLKVPERLLKTHGEVSLPVARAMARGAREILNCDWTVAVTGIAGPGGGSREKPVGTVCFAVCGPGLEDAKQTVFENTTRRQIQLESTQFALEFLWQKIRGDL